MKKKQKTIKPRNPVVRAMREAGLRGTRVPDKREDQQKRAVEKKLKDPNSWDVV